MLTHTESLKLNSAKREEETTHFVDPFFVVESFRCELMMDARHVSCCLQVFLKPQTVHHHL